MLGFFTPFSRYTRRADCVRLLDLMRHRLYHYETFGPKKQKTMLTLAAIVRAIDVAIW